MLLGVSDEPLCTPPCRIERTLAPPGADVRASVEQAAGGVFGFLFRGEAYVEPPAWARRTPACATKMKGDDEPDALAMHTGVPSIDG